MISSSSRASRLLVGMLLIFSLVAAACGSDSDDTAAEDTAATTAAPAEEPAETTEAPAEEPAETTEAPAEEPAEPDEPVQIAYLSASSANTWLLESRTAMEEIAAENNIEIVEFDAQFDPALQQTQFQDAISSGQYAGIVLVSLAGSGSIPDIEDALAAGIEVVILNQVVGDDLTTVEPQVEGMAAAVFEPPQPRGERLGEVTLAACEDIDPCNVVYFYGIRGIPLDEAVRLGWDNTVAGSTVNVVAEAEGQYLGPDVGLSAMQDILVGNSDIDVVVGADQSMQGVELALDDTDLTDVKIIGFGGSSFALEAIADGRWWGGIFGAPYTEGQLAMNAMIAALDGTDSGGVDPAQSVPNRGLMLPTNIGDFTAEWDG
ncbi:MAG: sugar ABC transporter substrate-binding protein [Acidimicrobiia bacterium]|nr:sugar ABC transporter substrate-binding protein [Acidimicrobiia bacterium]